MNLIPKKRGYHLLTIAPSIQLQISFIKLKLPYQQNKPCPFVRLARISCCFKSIIIGAFGALNAALGIAIPGDLIVAAFEEENAPAVENLEIVSCHSTDIHDEEIIVAVVVWREGIGDFDDTFHHIYVIEYRGVFAAFSICYNQFDLIISRQIPLMNGVDKFASAAIAKPPLPEINGAVNVITFIFEMNGIAGINRSYIIAGEGCRRLESVHRDVINSSENGGIYPTGSAVNGNQGNGIGA